MKTEQNKIVSLCYTLKCNGEIVDRATKKNPLEFLPGTGYLLPEFEKKIEGMQPGDTFDFVIDAENGYGLYDEDAVIELEKTLFTDAYGKSVDKILKLGESIPMQIDDDTVLQGTIMSIGDSTVKMNFNHQLAGCDLHFTGTILEIRDVSPEDLSKFCGCGCSCCDDDCECGCNDDQECDCDNQECECDDQECECDQ